MGLGVDARHVDNDAGGIKGVLDLFAIPLCVG